jgi:hypothetical protein
VRRSVSVRRLATTFAFYLLPFAFSLALACGRKTPPKPPELVRPATIENLAAEQTAEGIVLTWRRPETYADGTRMDDLGKFTIERSEDGGDFRVLAVLPVNDRDRFRKIRRLRFLDTTAVAGTRYSYRVISATSDNYVSEPSNPAEIVAGEAARP